MIFRKALNPDYAPCARKIKCWIGLDATTNGAVNLMLITFGTNQVVYMQASPNESFTTIPVDYVPENNPDTQFGNVRINLPDSLVLNPGEATLKTVTATFAGGMVNVTVA